MKLGGDTGERWNASVMRVGRPGNRRGDADAVRERKHYLTGQAVAVAGAGGVPVC
ncbi:hypothetical protein [Burkholderia dolosa]|uniref:hypothetical protein n=1 Tax=Burkholderia dolosa TaxID=152500 RepID=UPI0027D2A109|nr:hypothetical protein [Burkholderia dolosa]